MKGRTRITLTKLALWVTLSAWVVFCLCILLSVWVIQRLFAWSTCSNSLIASSTYLKRREKEQSKE